MPYHYGNSRAIWDHAVLPATPQKWRSRLYPSQLKLELDLATPEGCTAELTQLALRGEVITACVRRSVADKLKSGKHIEPELFTEASIYFSDIVSFTTLATDTK